MRNLSKAWGLLHLLSRIQVSTWLNSGVYRLTPSVCLFQLLLSSYSQPALHTIKNNAPINCAFCYSSGSGAYNSRGSMDASTQNIGLSMYRCSIKMSLSSFACTLAATNNLALVCGTTRDNSSYFFGAPSSGEAGAYRGN